MKVYAIKIDAMPFCDYTYKIAELCGGAMSRCVAACFTFETIIQMMFGVNSTLLQYGGVGYTNWMDMVPKPHIGNTPWEKRTEEEFPDWPWIKKGLPFKLYENGIKTYSKDVGQLGVGLGFFKYPEFFSQCTLIGNAQKNKDYIKKIQAQKESALFMLDYPFFHNACQDASDYNSMIDLWKIAYNQTEEMLNCFDFSERDSIFWLYSDHGPWRYPDFGGFPNINSFLTWVILVDNRKKSKTLPKIISACDFYNYAQGQKIKKDNDKIFVTVDGRMSINTKKDTTAIACKFLDFDNRDVPKKMKYLIYHKPADKFLQKTALFNNDLFVTQDTEQKEIDVELYNYLIHNYLLYERL